MNFLLASHCVAFFTILHGKVCYNGLSLMYGFVHPLPTGRGWEIEEEGK